MLDLCEPKSYAKSSVRNYTMTLKLRIETNIMRFLLYCDLDLLLLHCLNDWNINIITRAAYWLLVFKVEKCCYSWFVMHLLFVCYCLWLVTRDIVHRIRNLCFIIKVCYAWLLKINKWWRGSWVGFFSAYIDEILHICICGYVRGHPYNMSRSVGGVWRSMTE